MIRNLYVSSSNNKIIKNRVHKLVGLLKKELNFSIQLLFINFANGEEIHKINKKYLSHDYSTDIITFNYSGNHLELDGEIYISLDDALNSSQKYKVSLNSELKRLTIHGLLHLSGYNDIEKKDKKTMKTKENNLLNMYKFALLRYE